MERGAVVDELCQRGCEHISAMDGGRSTPGPGVGNSLGSSAPRAIERCASDRALPTEHLRPNSSRNRSSPARNSRTPAPSHNQRRVNHLLSPHARYRRSRPPGDGAKLHQHPARQGTARHGTGRDDSIRPRLGRSDAPTGRGSALLGVAIHDPTDRDASPCEGMMTEG